MMMGSDEKIEKIKSIAFKYFLEIGYEATTIRMICKDADIEAPTLYHFFKSKKGLFLEIRNDFLMEYKKLIASLELENEKSPEEALKKLYIFSTEYAINNPDNTRFYLRYQLFIPADLKDNIELHIKKSIEKKKALYGKFLGEMIIQNNLKIQLEEAFRRYSSFIDSNAYNAIFSGWKPGREELIKEWNIFFATYINIQ